MAEIPEISAAAGIDSTPGQRPQGGDRPAAAAQVPASLDSHGGPSAEISRAADAGQPAATSAAPETAGANGLQNARDRVEISPAAERALSVLATISQEGPRSLAPASAEIERAANGSAGGRAGQALGQAPRDSAPGRASLLDDAPSAGASIDTDPASRPDAAEADPLATNQEASAEIERAGNDGLSQSEASRTLGQVVDVFA